MRQATDDNLTQVQCMLDN